MVGWLFHPDPAESRGSIVMQIGKERSVYTIEEVVADFGRGFRVLKQWSEEPYYTNLHGGQYNTCLCSCLGHLRYGYCRHVEALLALEKNGQLPAGKVVRS
jgi:hypothetical protein